MIFPKPILPGQSIAIISPASVVKNEYIDGAAKFFEQKGYKVKIGEFAKGPNSGSFAASHLNRALDFRNAWIDPDVKCILCARGGYGCVHILNAISDEEIRNNPKWLIGFSDVSAIHARLLSVGVASLHASMAKHITINGEDEITKNLLNIITGDNKSISIDADPHPLNRLGKAKGILIGGNLAVLNGLANTPFDILNIPNNQDTILFIEDIAEKIYAVERMLTRLIIGGNIAKLKALVVGQFTEYNPDNNFSSMEEMIDALLKQYNINIPVAFGFNIGHIDNNFPIIEGANANIVISKSNVNLSFSNS